MAADNSLRRWSQIVTTPRSRYRRQFRIVRVFHKNFDPLVTLGYHSRLVNKSGVKLLFISPPSGLMFYNLHRFVGKNLFTSNLVCGLVESKFKYNIAGAFALGFLRCWRRNNYFIFKNFFSDLFWLLRGGWKNKPTYFNCLPHFVCSNTFFYGGRKA